MIFLPPNFFAGYGDMSLTKQSSRNFSIFYILVSTMVVAVALGNFGAVQMEIAAEKRRRELLSRKLDMNMISELDKDGDGVDIVNLFCKTEIVRIFKPFFLGGGGFLNSGRVFSRHADCHGKSHR